MVDLETLCVLPTATILTIAAQGFDPLTDAFTDVTFYRRITLDSQEGRSINDSTVEWWGKQSPEAQEEAFGEEDRVDLKTALEDFSKMAFHAKRIWANGTTFDIGILEDAMRRLEIPVPWKYWQVMDARTIYKLLPDMGSAGQSNSHHALEDCVNQIDMLQRALKTLGVTKL